MLEDNQAFTEDDHPTSLDAVFEYVKSQDVKIKRYRRERYFLIPSVLILLVCLVFFVVHEEEVDCRSRVFAAKFDAVIEALPLGSTDKQKEEAKETLKVDPDLKSSYAGCNKFP